MAAGFIGRFIELLFFFFCSCNNFFQFPFFGRKYTFFIRNRFFGFIKSRYFFSNFFVRILDVFFAKLYFKLYLLSVMPVVVVFILFRHKNKAKLSNVRK